MQYQPDSHQYGEPLEPIQSGQHDQLYITTDYRHKPTPNTARQTDTYQRHQHSSDKIIQILSFNLIMSGGVPFVLSIE